MELNVTLEKALFTDLTSLSAKTFSHFLLLGEYEIVYLFCHGTNNSFTNDLLQFWKSISINDTINETQINLLRWACSCFLHQFFDDISIPFYPFDASNSLEFIQTPAIFINFCLNNFPKMIQLFKQ